MTPAAKSPYAGYRFPGAIYTDVLYLHQSLRWCIRMAVGQ